VRFGTTADERIQRHSRQCNGHWGLVTDEWGLI
jgi:hypothetical protein